MALKVSRKHCHKGKLCWKKSWTYFLVLSGYLAEYRQNLIYGPNIPDSYVIFFLESDFTFTTTDIHNWVLFPLWPWRFLSGAISNCLLLFPSSIMDTFLPGRLIFQCHIFLPFHTVHRVVKVPDPPYLSPEKLVSQDATVRTGHGIIDWFKIGKGVWQGCVLSPCLFNLHAEYIMQNVRLDESHAGIKDCQEKYHQPKICRWYHSNDRKWRGPEKPLDEGQRGEWKNCLETFNIKKN